MPAAQPGTRTVLEEPPAQEKLLKYFPAEALALYSALDPLARGISGDEESGLLWVALIIAIIFCVMYLRRFWNIRSNAQLAISSFSLILYVAAFGGPFALLNGYDPLMGVALAVIASAFLIFVPTPKAPTTQ